MGQMRRAVVVALALTFLIGGIASAAQQVEGTIQTIDAMGKEIVLDNGSRVAVTDDTKIMQEGKEGRLEDLKPGGKVKASYEEKDGKNVATMLEVTN